jgi:hypothetical protein
LPAEIFDIFFSYSRSLWICHWRQWAFYQAAQLRFSSEDLRADNILMLKLWYLAFLQGILSRSSAYWFFQGWLIVPLLWSLSRLIDTVDTECTILGTLNLSKFFRALILVIILFRLNSLLNQLAFMTLINRASAWKRHWRSRIESPRASV